MEEKAYYAWLLLLQNRGKSDALAGKEIDECLLDSKSYLDGYRMGLLDTLSNALSKVNDFKAKYGDGK